MRGESYTTQTSLQLRGRSGGMRGQSLSPSRCVESSYTRQGRAGYQSRAVEVGTELHRDQANEKEEMQELNVKFAGYIGKVKVLEKRNAALRKELDGLQRRLKGAPVDIGEEYELKFKGANDLIGTLTNEKGAADIERGYLEEEVELWRLKLEEELALKDEAQMILKEFRKDVDDATLQRAELEKRVEQLVGEIEFLKRLHDDEVAVLMKQIEDAKITTDLAGDRPDLAGYLRDMRAEIETVASRSVEQAEKWYKSKFDSLRNQAGKNEDRLKAMKSEIATYTSRVTALQSDIDAMRARNTALELQLEDMEAAHGVNVAGLEETIAQLETQLCETKLEMSRYVHDYQELLHVKLKLDAEITTYRRLLEGEELRLGMGI